MPKPINIDEEFGSPKSAAFKPKKIDIESEFGDYSSFARSAKPAMVAEEFAATAPAAGVAKFREQLSRVSDPLERKRIRGVAETPLKEIRQAQRGIGTLRTEAIRRGEPRIAEAMTEAQVKARDPSAAPEPTAWETAKKVISYPLKAIDLPHHAIRQATTPGVAPLEREISSEEWFHRLREEAKKPEGAIGAKAATGAVEVLGQESVVGPVLGHAVATVGILSDLLAGETPSAQNIERTIEETKRSVGEFLVGAATDPVSYLTFGTSAVAKQLAGPIGRLAKKSGLGAAESAKLVDDVAGIVSRHGGSSEMAPLIRQRLIVADIPAAKIDKAFGKAGEFMGRGQLRAEIPLTGRGIDILPSITGKEFVGGKVYQRLLKPAVDRGLTQPFTRAKEIAKNLQREARGTQAILESQSIRQIKQIADGSGIKAARRKELVENHIDPDYWLVPLDDIPAAQRGAVKPFEFEGEKFGVIAKESYIPRAQLKPNEQKFVDDIADFLETQRQQLVRSGILKEETMAANPLSGKYFPRQYERLADVFEDLETSVAKGAGPSFAKKRIDVDELDLDEAVPTGVPLGRAAQARTDLKARTDPFEALPIYAKQTARAQAKNQLDRAIAQEFGGNVPPAVRRLVDGTFDQSFGTVSQFLRSKVGLGDTWVSRQVLGVLDANRRVLNRFKKLVLAKVPGFHVVNIVDDSSKMLAAGMNNPVKWLNRASKTIRQAKKGNKQALAQLQEANQQNIATDALNRLDIFAETGISKADLERAAGTNLTGAVGRSAAAANRLGEVAAEAWENNSKLAMFLWAKSKGRSNRDAASQAFDVLLDYSDRGKFLNMARWVMPFATWMAKSPKAVGKLAAARPGRVQAQYRAMEALQEKDEAPEAPTYATERGPVYRAPRELKRAVGQIRKAMGGTAIPEGLGLSYLPRLSFGEALAPYTQAMTGNVDPFVMSLHPFVAPISEYISERDWRSKQKALRTEPSAMFPEGFPGVPADIQASAGQIPWLTRYAPQYLMSPVSQFAANLALRQATPEGEVEPISMIGPQRMFTKGRDPQNILSHQLWNLLTRHPLYTTSPESALWDLARKPETQQLIRSAQMARKRTEERARQQR